MKITKKIILIAIFVLVSLNAFATNDMSGKDQEEVEISVSVGSDSDDNMDQLACIHTAYQRSTENHHTDISLFRELLAQCDE